MLCTDPDSFSEPRYTGLTNHPANTVTEYLRLKVVRLPTDEELKRALKYRSAFAASTTALVSFTTFPQSQVIREKDLWFCEASRKQLQPGEPAFTY